MAAATAPIETHGPQPVTLLQLVQAVTDVADNENEVIATVLYMLSKGSVELCGNFRGASVREFC